VRLPPAQRLAADVLVRVREPKLVGGMSKHPGEQISKLPNAVVVVLQLAWQAYLPQPGATGIEV
jgi:hypothetical protein